MPPNTHTHTYTHARFHARKHARQTNNSDTFHAKDIFKRLRYKYSSVTGLLSGTRKFHITSGKSMNYETTKVFNCTFICNDGKHDGDIEFIEITVEDVNDACVFDTSTPYTAIMTEGGVSKFEHSCRGQRDEISLRPLAVRPLHHGIYQILDKHGGQRNQVIDE